jgi:hypothetical protein
LALTKRRPAKKKKRTMTRYVYLLERVSGKTRESRKRGLREIKIGISKNGKYRAGRVDEGIPGRVVFLRQFKVLSASRVENDLHTKYEEANFHVEGAKKGAGGTEFFRLRTKQVDAIIRSLEKVEENGVRLKKAEDWLEDDDMKTPPIILVFFLSAALMAFIQYLKTN